METYSWFALRPATGAFMAGIGLGLFYFGGLWFTVRRVTKTEKPALLFLGSFASRTLLSVLGFYWLAQAHWAYLLAGMAGFLMMRLILTHWLGPETRSAQCSSQPPPLQNVPD